jgi:formylglycine-generating enzyme
VIALAIAAVLVGPGTYEGTPVAAFRLDREPVTNAEFLAFVRANPKWARDRVPSALADADYLAAIDSASPNAPVVRVSWFAARAFCSSHGGRLPSEAEWELAAQSDADDLDWYGKPTPATLPDVGGPANAWGARDLHGLVWEWIEDFTASIVAADCGGAVSNTDPTSYASYLRASFRSSLSGRDTISSLGFRCAYDRSVR